MKKAIKVNISGIIFDIDEDAYLRLKEYLDAINERFSNNDEGKEVVADVETRIAELFQERIDISKQVIVSEDVKAVIEIMGKPEDFSDLEQEEELTEPKRYRTHRSKRRAYRDGENRIFGGVCSGLAQYFNIDAVLMRVIFILAIFVIGPFNLLVYFILMFSLPVAETAAQKLEMRGEPITVHNIQRTIKEEFNDVKEGFNNYRKSKLNNSFDKFFHLFGIIISAIFRLFVFAFGGFLMIFGSVLLIALLISFSFHNPTFGPVMFHGGFPLPHFLRFMLDSQNITLGLIALFIVISIPLLSLIYAGVRMIFRFKFHDKLVGLVAFAVWFVGVILFIVVAVNEGSKYSVHSFTAENQILQQFTGDTLYLSKNDVELPENQDDVDRRMNFDGYRFMNVNGVDRIYSEPQVNIIKSNTADFEVVVKRSARGALRQEAVDNSKTIIYFWKQQDSLLLFDSHFSTKENSKWRRQELNITIKVPEGKYVMINEGVENILFDVDNEEDMWDGYMGGKLWKMKSNELTLVRPKIQNNGTEVQENDSDLREMEKEMKKMK